MTTYGLVPLDQEGPYVMECPVLKWEKVSRYGPNHRVDPRVTVVLHFPFHVLWHFEGIQDFQIIIGHV